MLTSNSHSQNPTQKPFAPVARECLSSGRIPEMHFVFLTQKPYFKNKLLRWFHAKSKLQIQVSVKHREMYTNFQNHITGGLRGTRHRWMGTEMSQQLLSAHGSFTSSATGYLLMSHRADAHLPHLEDFEGNRCVNSSTPLPIPKAGSEMCRLPLPGIFPAGLCHVACSCNCCDGWVSCL